LRPNSDYKFRSLQNVNELVQTAVGPEMFEFYSRFKKWFSQENVHWISARGVRWAVTMTYAGSFSDVELTRWMQNALNTLSPATVHIIASGDDVLVVTCNPKGAVEVHELDAKMFDQSQGQGVLKYENATMLRFGVPPNVVDILYKSAGGKLIAPFGAFGWNNVWVLDFSQRLIRMSGGVNTSSGNSNSSLSSAAAAFTLFPDTMPVAERYAVLGFDVKHKQFDNVLQATFLKGMWYQTTDGLFWGPLPSRVLKLGKSVTPITHLFSDLRHRLKNRPEEFLTAAATRFVQEVLMGYRQLLRVPLLGDMCANWKMAQGKMHVPIDQYTVAASSGHKPNLTPAGVRQVCRRYDITETELVEAIALLPRGPFTIVDHRVFRQMALVDYY